MHKAAPAYEITVDYMMIIAKYFTKPKDYVNAMKVNSKYHDLVLMYKFNPIGEVSLFPNVQTQHFYTKLDFKTILPKMYRYVYWGTFTKKQETAVKHVNSRKYVVNTFDKSPFVKDKLISKNIDHRHIMSLLEGLPFTCKGVVYDSTVKPSTDEPEYKGMAIQICYDDDNNSIAFLRGYNKSSSFNRLIASLNRVSYYDSITDIKVFKQDNRNLSIFSNPNKVTMDFITNTELEFEIVKDRVGRYVMKITNHGFTYTELSSLMFPEAIMSRSNPSLIKFNIKRYVLYELESQITDEYYDKLLTTRFGRPFNVLLDTWTTPFGISYNIGYVRYIDSDEDGNSIMFNVLPTQIIITTNIRGVIRNIKPLCDMSRVVMDIEGGLYNVYTRYDFYTKSFASYYNTVWSDIIYPLESFCSNRRLVCTNQFTRCSCVRNKDYFIRVRDQKFVNY